MYETSMKQGMKLSQFMFLFFFGQQVASIHVVVSCPGITSAFTCGVLSLYTILSRNQAPDLRYTTIRRASVLSENACN